MKDEPQSRDPLLSAPREERAILDEIRNDHELIDRLKITPEELGALSKCALFGTLTCKQDMLFILREIREAGQDSTDAVPLPSRQAAFEEEREKRRPDFRRIPIRIAPAGMPEPGSLDSIVRRRLPEQLGVHFWVAVLAAGLVWNGVIVMSRWRDKFMTTLGPAAAPTTSSDAWYSHLDHPNALIWFEVLFVGCAALVLYLRSRRRTRHLKVRPVGRAR